MVQDEAAPRPRCYIFYDYVCPYAYVGKLRADRLAEELDVEFVWLPWEIYPETNPAGEPMSGDYPPPQVKEWIDRLANHMGAQLNNPGIGINSNLALRGAEYAKDQGGDAFERYHTLAYEAVWKHGRNLGDEAVLREVVEGAGLDADAFFRDARHPAYQARLDAVDRAATRLGVQRVPTFVFGDQRIVGNDAHEESLRRPLEAFLERWKAVGEDGATTLEEDVGLTELL